MDDKDYALSQLLLNAASPSPFLTSPTQSPAPEPLPQAQQRPISKRRGKKRSSRACGACRTRKVRCNIVAHGAPCSNCRHDEVDCVLPLSRRQKSARERVEREQMEQSMRDSIFSAEVGDDFMASVELDSTPKLNAQRPAATQNAQTSQFDRAKSRAKTQLLAPHEMAISEHPLAEILSASNINLPQAGVIPPAISSRTKSWFQIASPLASAPIPQTASQVPKLPSIFAPFPRRLDTHDLAYLNSRDALTLPSETFQIALLKAYIDFVHPTFPVLDLEDFLSVIKYGFEGLEDGNGKAVERETAGKNKIPFLLFQAVMFAGLDFVGTKFLKEAGYKTKEWAKKVFFDRVKLLYDFDTLTDRLSIIQSLLLMTLSPPSSHDMKDSWHWLGLAISLSYSLGLNRTPHSQPDIRRRRLERRVWWTTFIRDRSLALDPGAGTGWARPMRIKRVDCDIEMLSPEDFEFGVGDEDNGSEEMRMKMCTEAYVEKAKLCWCCDEAIASSFVRIWNQSETFFSASVSAVSSPPQTESRQGVEMAEPFRGEIVEHSTYESREELKYHVALSLSSPSPSDDCVTPQEYHDTEFIEEDKNQAEKVVCSPLVAGYGVDGEYDDYLEFLKDPVLAEGALAKDKGKERNRTTWAFQFDCVNDRVLGV